MIRLTRCSPEEHRYALFNIPIANFAQWQGKGLTILTGL